MKTHYPNFHDRPNSQLNEDSYSDSSVSKFSTSELKLRRPIRASYAESIEDDIQTAVTSNGKLSANKVQLKASNDEETTTARYNPAVRTLFSCLILMGFGLFLLYLAADGEIFSRNGHWRFKFGPQLRYVSLFLKDYKFIMSIFWNSLLIFTILGQWSSAIVRKRCHQAIHVVVFLISLYPATYLMCLSHFWLLIICNSQLLFIPVQIFQKCLLWLVKLLEI